MVGMGSKWDVCLVCFGHASGLVMGGLGKHVEEGLVQASMQVGAWLLYGKGEDGQWAREGRDMHGETRWLWTFRP